jgi:hypothetical protein
MMETEEISGMPVFSSTLTRLITQEDFSTRKKYGTCVGNCMQAPIYNDWETTKGDWLDMYEDYAESNLCLF